LSEQQGRRAALRARVAASLRHELSGDEARDAAQIDQAVEEQVLAVGRANVSRAISDLARAGLVTRHYAGYATNHRNRGGGRHAVYVVNPAVLKLLRRPALMIGAVRASGTGQGELFAA
jgi:DNA-binding transcriptional ArsR family regulator